MVDCGVASKLPQPIYMDRDGNRTTNIEKAFGLPCTNNIKHPDMCLVVDEVGSNPSQKGYGHIDGRKVMCARKIQLHKNKSNMKKNTLHYLASQP